MEIEAIQADARRLATHMQACHGWSLDTAGCLAALAASRGHKDWKAYAAILRAGARATPSPAVTEGYPPPGLRTPSVGWTLDRLLDAAIENHASVIHLRLHQNAPSEVHFRIDGLLVQLAKLDIGRTAVLRETLALPDSVDRTIEGKLEHSYWGRPGVFGWRAMPTNASNTGEAVVALVPPVWSREAHCELAPCAGWDAEALATRPGLYLVAGTSGSGTDTFLRRLVADGERAALAIGALSASSDEPLSTGPAQFIYDNRTPATMVGQLVRKIALGGHKILVCAKVHDQESAIAALRAVQAGLTVIVGLHASSVNGAVEHIAGLAGLKAADLEGELRGVRVQALLPKTCPHCKGARCAHCGARGVFGQVAVAETVLLDAVTTPAALRAAAPGWESLQHQTARLIAKGLVPEPL